MIYDAVVVGAGPVGRSTGDWACRARHSSCAPGRIALPTRLSHAPSTLLLPAMPVLDRLGLLEPVRAAGAAIGGNGRVISPGGRGTGTRLPGRRWIGTQLQDYPGFVSSTNSWSLAVANSASRSSKGRAYAMSRPATASLGASSQPATAIQVSFGAGSLSAPTVIIQLSPGCSTSTFRYAGREGLAWPRLERAIRWQMRWGRCTGISPLLRDCATGAGQK